MKQQIRNLYSDLREELSIRIILIVFLIFLLPVIFNEYIITGLLISLSLIGVLAAKFFRITRIGLEFTTLTTTILGIVYGPEIGAAAALILITFQMFGGGHKGVYIFWVIPTYVIVGFLAGFLSGYDPIMLAIGLLIFIHTVCTLLTAVITPGNLHMYITYAAGNMVFNLFLILSFLQPVLSAI